MNYLHRSGVTLRERLLVSVGKGGDLSLIVRTGKPRSGVRVRAIAATFKNGKILLFISNSICLQIGIPLRPQHSGCAGIGARNEKPWRDGCFLKKEGFDTETANGEMILSMICSVAQEESLSLQEHEMEYTQTNAERNLCNCIHTVWLSTRKNRKLIPYEPEALVVRFIYAQYLAGRV